MISNGKMNGRNIGSQSNLQNGVDSYNNVQMNKSYDEQIEICAEMSFSKCDAIIFGYHARIMRKRKIATKKV